MHLVFLDANVLFSAAYKPRNRLLKLWVMDKVSLTTSLYALEEANRNLPTLKQKAVLSSLAKGMEIISVIPSIFHIEPALTIPDKDLPIIIAAISAKARYLITGDIAHFGSYFGKKIKGVLILPPTRFFDLMEKECTRKLKDGE